MITFTQYLEEQSRAPLYHVTDWYGMQDILDTKVLANPNTVNGAVNSFTRSYQYAKDFGRSRYAGRYFILVFDQDKLRTRYKLEPYRFWKQSKAYVKPDVTSPVYTTSNNEFEEVIHGEIKDVMRYIIEIQAPPTIYREVRDDMGMYKLKASPLLTKVKYR